MTPKKQLKEEGWSKESIDYYQRFQKRIALLFPYLEVENGVLVKGKGATLHRITSGEALVQFTAGEPDSRFKKHGKPCVPLTSVNPEIVRPGS